MQTSRDQYEDATILIIDDNHNNLRLLGNLFHSQGYAVRLAASGQLGLMTAQSTPVDIILLDIMMPDMDGYAVCRALKANVQTRAIPVIFVSALVEVFDKVKGFSAGGADYITKPFQMDEVLARISTHLALRRMQQQLQHQNDSLQQEIVERKRIEDALRESERRFRLLAENAQDIIYRYRLLPDKGFDYVSPSVQQITGYSPEAYYADPDIHKKIVHPDQHMLFEAMHQAPDTFHDPLILNCTHKDGHEIWLEQHQWPIYNEQHQVVAIEGITRDITERKRVDNQLMQHQQALSMLRERERLAREMHDNLGQVLGYLNLQLQNIGEYITSGHLAMASTFLSNMAKVVHETQSDLGECIVGTKVITQMQADHTEEQGFFTALEQYLVWFEHLYTIKPELQLDPALTDQHLPPVVSMHLLRIIQEALNNIRKYAGVRAARISFARDLDQAVVIIADDGAGFDLSQLSAVTPDTNNSQGYGLHSMRSRAEEIDGHLTIETKPGVGTRVILRFPLHMAEAMVAPHFRLLLVDDNRLFLHAMHKMLTNYHFEVVGTAQDGIEALEQARKLNPDVILMDIEMPRCDGLEATRMIKAEFPEVQIVILTISDDEQNLFEAIKSGASGYLLKSLDVEELCHLLFGLAQDEAPLSPGLAARVLREFARQRKLVHYRAVEEEPPLSRRQIDILTLVAQGYTYKEVGDILGFSDSMIKKDMSSTMKQLHLKNRADAIAYARRKMARGAWSLPGRE